MILRAVVPISRSGNSLEVTIPRKVADFLHLKRRDLVELIADETGVLLVRVQHSPLTPRMVAATIAERTTSEPPS